MTVNTQMAVNNSTSTGNSQAAQSASSQQASGPSLDYNSFLNLLIAQMKNQDPTQPMDSTQFVAQLATFSQVEQSVQTNSKLDQLLQQSALASAGSVIGHTVTSADGTVTGTVSSVTMSSSGLTAQLTNGGSLALQDGVVVQ